MEPLVRESLPEPSLDRADAKARLIIWTVSIVVFTAVALLSKIKLAVSLPFNPHLFATINAWINSTVTLLLIAGLLAVRAGKYILHKKIMLTAIVLSLLFLLSYICHHLLGGETKFGDLDHDGVVSTQELALAGSRRYLYYIILATHIPLAGIILPFILFTAYRALTADYGRHMKLARITWPVWLYVAITGVVVYWMISPYYSA
jgi:putative membrane protein